MIMVKKEKINKKRNACDKSPRLSQGVAACMYLGGGVGSTQAFASPPYTQN
jgi:hypothetical protein